jgi:hypothetical protein
VPEDNLLGAEGDQIWYVFEVIAPYFLTAMAGTYLGIAQASLDEARSHLLARRHSHTGRTLSAEPVLQHRLGVLWAQVQRTRRLVHWAADESDSGGPEALAALAAAKAEVADCAVEVTNEAMTLVGGIGYRDRSPLERHLRDARAAHVMSPTTDLLRTWTGRRCSTCPCSVTEPSLVAAVTGGTPTGTCGATPGSRSWRPMPPGDDAVDVVVVGPAEPARWPPAQRLHRAHPRRRWCWSCRPATRTGVRRGGRLRPRRARGTSSSTTRAPRTSSPGGPWRSGPRRSSAATTGAARGSGAPAHRGERRARATGLDCARARCWTTLRSGVLLVDPSGALESWNARAVAMVGARRAPAGDRWTELFSDPSTGGGSAGVGGRGGRGRAGRRPGAPVASRSRSSSAS